MDTNPYQAPKEQQPTADQPTCPAGMPGWRVIPALFIGVLGAAVMLFGLVALGETVMFLSWSLPNAPSQSTGILIHIVQILNFGMVLGGGFLWMTSALAFWRCRWQSACTRFALGFGILAVPAVLTVLAISAFAA